MSEQPESQEPAKPSMLPKILVGGFITTIVVFETFIFFFMVPSADEVAALAEARLVEKLEANMAADGEETVEDADATKEFMLGEYRVGFKPPGSDRTYQLEFRPFGTVKEKDYERLEQLYKERKGRFRDRMILEVRNATMDELEEKQLGLIRRRILATSNEILGEPILMAIGFNDYQLSEE